MLDLVHRGHQAVLAILQHEVPPRGVDQHVAR
jgi:FAD synthase